MELIFQVLHLTNKYRGCRVSCEGTSIVNVSSPSSSRVKTTVPHTVCVLASSLLIGCSAEVALRHNTRERQRLLIRASSFPVFTTFSFLTSCVDLLLGLVRCILGWKRNMAMTLASRCHQLMSQKSRVERCAQSKGVQLLRNFKLFCDSFSKHQFNSCYCI